MSNSGEEKFATLTLLFIICAFVWGSALFPALTKIHTASSAIIVVLHYFSRIRYCEIKIPGNTLCKTLKPREELIFVKCLCWVYCLIAILAALKNWFHVEKLQFQSCEKMTQYPENVNICPSQLKRTGNQILLKGGDLEDAITAAITAMNEPKTCSFTTLRRYLVDANKDRKEYQLGKIPSLCC